MTGNANVKQAVPFFRVSNIEKSVRYYVDGLGFEMTRKWIVEGKLRWCWLQHGGAALMLQEFPKEEHDSWSPQAKVGEGVSICYQCDDALAIYRAVTARGIRASRPFVGNGMLVTSLSDPDGYRIEFEEPHGCAVRTRSTQIPANSRCGALFRDQPLDSLGRAFALRASQPS